MKANYENKTKAQGELQLNLYDLNKQIIAQLPDYTEDDFTKAYLLLDEYSKNKNWCMLLGREINYYTIFHNLIKDADETFASAVIDCCKYLGTVKSIAWANEDNHEAIEIWITIENEPIALYLFDYSQGVIECQM